MKKTLNFWTYPTLVNIFMSLKSTFVAVAGSMTLSTASTAIGESSDECCETTFEFKDVAALCNSDWRSVSRSGMLIFCKISFDFSAALKNDSEIAVGWIPFDRSFDAASNNAPAITTTVVVPSPASISCAFDSSTN